MILSRKLKGSSNLDENFESKIYDDLGSKKLQNKGGGITAKF